MSAFPADHRPVIAHVRVDSGAFVLLRVWEPQWTRQLMRYGVVGLGSNAVLYACYLLLTSRGVGPKTAMSLLYVVGVLQTFVLNRRWTFGHRGSVPVSLARYGMCYASGYLFNWLMLFLLVDQARWPHRPTQAVLIVMTAIILFVLQKYWVFAGRAPASLREPGGGGVERS